MGTVNKIIALFLFLFCNINSLLAQCEVLFDNGVVHIDSIIGENSMDMNKEYVITDNETIIFITLINDLYPNIKPFTRRNTDRAIVTTMEEIKVLASFLSENKSAILKRTNDLHNSTFCKGKCKKIDFDDVRLRHAALLHFLDRNLGNNFLDFESVCKYHLEAIKKGKDEQGDWIMPSGNEYVFMLTLLGLTENAYNWNHHARYIDDYSLTMFSNWCKDHYNDTNAQRQFFDELCVQKLLYYLYFPD